MERLAKDVAFAARNTAILVPAVAEMLLLIKRGLVLRLYVL
jgi:hypothetical protein